jgi:nucleoside-diphosphate-sugar epimerase
MRVFVTGATGFVGSAVVQELLAAGHEVLALARSEASAAALQEEGIAVHRGSLEEPAALRRGAAEADGVIHTAFIHDFTRFAASCETDRRVIEALAAELAGSDRPLIVTSGTGVLRTGGVVTEDDRAPPDHPNPRIATEQAADAAAMQGARALVVRLPQVHGDGDHGFTPLLCGIARDKGVAAYIGDGSNRWSAVHRFDAARLYRLALEKAGPPGTRYHAVAEEGVPLREISDVIGRQLNVPAVSIPPEQAAEHFGWFAHFAAMDNGTSSRRTRDDLGWEPKEIGLIADISRPGYFG